MSRNGRALTTNPKISLFAKLKLGLAFCLISLFLIACSGGDNLIFGGNNQPVIATISAQTNQTGSVVNVTVAVVDADGDTLNYSASGLPLGVSISPTTGEITGTATTPGTYNVTINVSDGKSIATTNFTWTVSDNGTTPPPTKNNKVDYARFNNTLPDWNTFSPPKADSGPVKTSNIVTSETRVIGDMQYACSTTPYSLTKNPEKIVTFEPDAGILYPGSIIQGKGHVLGIGSLKELPIRQRAPLTLTIDLLTSDNTETIQNPDVSTVQSALGNLISKAQTAGHVGGSKAVYTEKLTHSVEQAALQLGLSARYMRGSVTGSLDASRSLDKTTLTASFIQNLFTVSIVQPQSPGGWFSDEFTQDLLDQQKALGNIGPDNIPVYVANITYGRILHFSFTSTASEREIRGALSASYDGGTASGSVQLTAEQKEILRTAEIKIAQVGGTSNQIESLIRAGNIKAYFESDIKLTSAKPISYTLKNLGDNSVAKVAETTNYNVTQCNVTDVEKKIIGERVKITLENIYVTRVDGDNDHVFGQVVLNGKTYDIPQDQRADGTTITLSKSLEKTFLYGSSDNQIDINGFLDENDFTSADENIGKWGVRYKPVFNPDGSAGVGRSYVGTAYTIPLYRTGNDDNSAAGDGSARLRWKIEHVNDIREGDPILPEEYNW